ncbi:MAG: hypothetical protein ACRDRP_05720 [Pseudonocardiaceae bacterium]
MSIITRRHCEPPEAGPGRAMLPPESSPGPARFGGMYRPMCTVIEMETGADVPAMSGSSRDER